MCGTDPYSTDDVPLSAMIDAHDRLYGEGSGHAFFMGPYLEVLPAAVSRQVRGNIP